MVTQSNTNVRKARSAKGRALARAGDPLVLADGTLVHEDEKPRAVITDKVINPATFRPPKRRNVNELPATAKTMNAVAVVFLYTMLGVGDREIADLLGVTTVEIAAVRQHEAYAEAFEIIINTFIDSNSEMLQSRIAAMSHAALDTMGELSAGHHGARARDRFEASADLLNRAGVSPKEAAAARGSGAMTGMRIIMLEGDAPVDVDVEIDA